ncbi:hypothetical protein [Mucilaginibacter sp. FT3.2]|uniref:hypothetical protein n=1 Tax=Mucilaginibacter sp. FT3.2 TaxID=2723090 RepID=UPI0016204F86|nr:hypothetical protein [Mucilaginibacter sp. FT3.2]MBB6234848.1 hypothetical protein [Mucilaginibacter sp. FT3.2]
MKQKIIYILPGLFAIAFIALVLIGNVGPSEACKDRMDFVGSTYKAIVIKKYLDKENHNYKTILYSNNKLSIMRLMDDTSGYSVPAGSLGEDPAVAHSKS